MAQGMGGKSPPNIQKHLAGVNYPASKQEIINRARQNNAPNDILDELQRLPEQRFSGPQDIQRAYGRME